MKKGIKTLAMWLIIGVIVIVLLSSIMENSSSKMTYSELITSIENSDVESIKISSNGNLAAVKLKEFNEQEKVIKSRIILLTVKELMGSAQRIEKIHIEDIIKLCSNNIGNKYLTPNKNIKFLIKDKKIYITSL